MEIYPITRERLSLMRDILSESAGYEVSIEDEIEYFDPVNAVGWYLSQNSRGEVIGFVRHFLQNSEWSLGELYVTPGAEERAQAASLLLQKFADTVSFAGRHRLRFDVYQDDRDLNDVLKRLGFSQQQQIFRHFEWIVKEVTQECLPDEVSVFDAGSVAEVLCHLHSVSENEAREWIESGTIRIVRDGTRIVAAAQLYDSEQATEINRIATHARHLRRGHAKKLMQSIFAHASLHRKKRIHLKVEDNRTEAILFYKSVGFSEDRRRCQVWHSRWYGISLPIGSEERNS